MVLVDQNSEFDSGQNKMKTKRVKVAGESTIRQLLLMLLSMIVTFFILMANKSWILQQVGTFSVPKEGQPTETVTKAPATVTTKEAKQSKSPLFLPLSARHDSK